MAAAWPAWPAIAAKPGDAEAIPHLDSQGKEGYREFLSAGKHRAFVIAPGGAWAWKGDEPTVDSAVEGAIQKCQHGTEQPCVPYVVDDKVVFDARVGRHCGGPSEPRGSGQGAYRQGARRPVLRSRHQESRPDLSVSFQPQRTFFARWDRIFRERRTDQGWHGSRAGGGSDPEPRETEGPLALLDRVWGAWPTASATGLEWAGGVDLHLERPGVPRGPGRDRGPAVGPAPCRGPRNRKWALGSETMGAAEFQEWLTLGARQVLLPGPGIQEAGIQVLGLLETRGLAFSRVFCLGSTPAPCRRPPCSLAPAQRSLPQAVLGGTYRSQHRFAQELFGTFLGLLPDCPDPAPGGGGPRTGGQPRLPGEVGTPGERGAERAWSCLAAVAGAVLAAFRSRAPPPFEGYGDGLFKMPVPQQLSLSQVAAALRCPCRFLLEVLRQFRHGQENFQQKPAGASQGRGRLAEGKLLGHRHLKQAVAVPLKGREGPGPKGRQHRRRPQPGGSRHAQHRALPGFPLPQVTGAAHPFFVLRHPGPGQDDLGGGPRKVPNSSWANRCWL